MAVQISGNDITVPRDGTFTRNVTIGGTLTYEDVTNIDSVGLVTARTGIEIGAKPGVAASISIDGNAIFSGITTIATLRATTGIVTAFQGNVTSTSSSYHQYYALGTSTVGGIRFGNSAHTNGYIYYDNGPNMNFNVAGSERLRINSSGKVIVGNNGTTFGNAAVQAFIQHGNTAGESGFSSVDTTSVAAGVGGEIAFHGKYNTGAQDYAYLGHVRGIKENATAGNTACALTFHTRPNATAPQERLRIASDGRVYIGNTQDSSPYSWNLGLQISGTSTNAGLSIRRDQSGSGGALLMFVKSRGSLNGNTIVSADDQIGGMYFNAADGTDVNNVAASIAAFVDGSPGSNDTPGRLIFSTTSDGSGSATERMRIRNNGLVTKPYQYYLLVDRSSDLGGYDANGSFGTPLIFNRIITEQKDSSMSSAYGTGTGLFTAPVSGVYQLIASAYNSSGVSFTQSWFTYNGARMLYSDWVKHSSTLTQNSQIVYLTAGNTVGFHPHAGGGNSSITIQANGNHTYMKITLLH